MGIAGVIFLVIVIFFILLRPENEMEKQQRIEAHKKEMVKVALEEHEILNKNFYKSFAPLCNEMEALQDYYDRGNKRLTEEEACMFFSYPKTICIDKDDNITINGIKMGKALEHKSLSCLSYNTPEVVGDDDFNKYYGMKDKSYIQSTYPRYNFIKNKCNGCITLTDYQATLSFTDIYPNANKVINNPKKHSVKKMVGQKKIDKEDLKKFNKYYGVLPKMYKEFSYDIKEHDYSLDELKEKYSTLYQKSQENYYKSISKEDIENLQKQKEESKSYQEAANQYISKFCPENYTKEEQEYLKGLNDLFFVDAEFKKERRKNFEKECMEKYPDLFKK